MYVKDLLKGKTALVTGGATGIGLVVAKALADHGAKIVLAARQPDRLEAAAKQLGGRAIPTDISDPAQVKELFDKAGRVDILVNNAAANFIRPSETLTPVRWKKIIDIVLNGTFYCTLEAGRRMLEQGGGRIISMVAAYAWTGAPGLAPSACAKAGIVAMTRTLGVEWAKRGVTVNAVCPGLIDTPQSRERMWPEDWMREAILKSIPAGRFGTEQEVADATLYLAAPSSSYVTGEVLVVDGGECLGKGAAELIEKAGIIRKARVKA